MNYHDIILNYLEVIISSWPLFIFIILLIYRRYFSNLLERIYKGRLYGVSFEAIPIIQKDEVPQNKLFNSPIDRAVEYIKNNPKDAFDEYVKTYKFFVFEKVFHFIFGTQIRLLEYLANRENNFEKREILNNFYNEYLKMTNPKFPRSTLEQYFAFLYGYKFIEDFKENDQIYTRLSDLGKEFLVYIRNQYSLFYTSKPY